MRITKLRYGFISLLMLLSSWVFSAESRLPSINLWQQWTFSGSAIDESGLAYYYYFVFQQFKGTRMVDVIVLSDKLEEIIRYHKSSEKESIQSQKPNIWKVGRSFFRFNPITKSWVFGLKTKGDKGFNFKADIRPEDGDMGERQSIFEGLDAEVDQFNQLNGHLFFAEENKERFVTSKRGWLRYIEGKTPPQQLEALLCNQEDGAGLYSLRFQSTKAKKAAIVGMRNAKGEREQVSQFLTIKHQSDNHWHLKIPSPSTSWQMQEIGKFINMPFDTIVLTKQPEKLNAICFYQSNHVDN